MVHIMFYITYYNTALFSYFPLYGLAGYIVHIHGFFFNIHGSRVEPLPIDLFDWLKLVEMVNSMASKQEPLRQIKRLVWLQNNRQQ